MKVYDALQLILRTVEDSSSCGMLEEKVRIAKLTLKKYVEEKLIEDIEKEKKEG